MNTYRVGFIGCGGIARAHAPGYRGLRNARIEFVAGADIDPQGANARRMADEYGIPVYKEYREMLDRHALDLVSVCTWPRTHCESTIAAAEHGVKGILCEKPMAISLSEADRMIEACAKSGTSLAIGHAHRFSPQAVKARDWVRQGEIGKLELISGHCSLDLMNNGTHVIDLIHFLNGDAAPVWVMGQIDRRRKLEGRSNHPDMIMEDMAVGRVEYANGVVGLIELGERADPSFAFKLVGTDGVIEVNRPNGPTLKILSGFRQRGWFAPDLPDLPPAFQGELEELVDVVEGRATHRNAAPNGRRALEVIMGIFESSNRRCVLDFPIAAQDFVLERMIREGVV
ncbi:MAG: Gfo/Idh/MocA family oxidoreductase [candidate division Zixibacteria bacterium]|nr:Gfo/Idh/MocA family oxidoreductase [candidate division Zixibacteria bacterium]